MGTIKGEGRPPLQLTEEVCGIASYQLYSSGVQGEPRLKTKLVHSKADCSNHFADSQLQCNKLLTTQPKLQNKQNFHKNSTNYSTIPIYSWEIRGVGFVSLLAIRHWTLTHDQQFDSNVIREIFLSDTLCRFGHCVPSDVDLSDCDRATGTAAIERAKTAGARGRIRYSIGFDLQKTSFRFGCHHSLNHDVRTQSPITTGRAHTATAAAAAAAGAATDISRIINIARKKTYGDSVFDFLTDSATIRVILSIT